MSVLDRPSARPEILEIEKLDLEAFESSIAATFGDVRIPSGYSGCFGWVATIGDLKRWIAGSVAVVPAAGCATQGPFYRLRRAAAAAGVPARAIRPGTRWSDLEFPQGDWRAACRTIWKRSGCPRPIGSPAGQRWKSAAHGIFLVLFTAAACLLAERDAPGGSLIVLAVALAGVAGALAAGRSPGPRPAMDRTVGDTARLLAALEAQRRPPAAPAGRTWTREGISLTVDRLFRDCTGVRDFTDASIPVPKDGVLG